MEKKVISSLVLLALVFMSLLVPHYGVSASPLPEKVTDDELAKVIGYDREVRVTVIKVVEDEQVTLKIGQQEYEIVRKQKNQNIRFSVLYGGSFDFPDHEVFPFSKGLGAAKLTDYLPWNGTLRITHHEGVQVMLDSIELKKELDIFGRHKWNMGGGKPVIFRQAFGDWFYAAPLGGCTISINYVDMKGVRLSVDAGRNDSYQFCLVGSTVPVTDMGGKTVFLVWDQKSGDFTIKK